MKNSGVEWIGEIPDDWEVVRNKNTFTCNKDIVGEKSKDTQLLSLTTAGIKCKDINNAEGKLPETFDTYQSVRKNDVVMCLFDLDMSAVFSGISAYNGMISPAYKVLTCRDNINPLFIHYWFSYIFDGRKFNHYAKNIRYTLNYDEFASLPILLPPKETQQKIASYLDSKCSKIQETIQNQQQVIEKLKVYKQSLITEAVTGKIKIQNGKACGKYEEYKDSGVEWIGEIPSGWNVGKFGRFATVKSNLVDPKLYLDYPQIAPDNIEKSSGRLISYQSVRDSGVISWNHLFFKGQIVYSKIRPTLNKLIIAPFDGLCSADMYPIETELDKHFFVYMMLSLYFVEQVGLITRDRVKMPKINQNELSGILITVPSNEEQKNIAEYLDKKCLAIDNAIEQKQKLIEKLTEYKKSLIYECVTGKKDV